MIRLLTGYALTSVVLATASVASAQDGVDTKAAFVCKLVPAGQSPNVKGWNFGLLMDGEPKSASEAPVPILETVDKRRILSGAQIVRFHDNGNGYFAGVTGPLKDEHTLMLSLSKSSKGPWFDTGVGLLSGTKDPIFIGACFGLKTKDTTTDFHRAMASEGSSQ